jgi:adhesin transport system outer membrane protein
MSISTHADEVSSWGLQQLISEAVKKNPGLKGEQLSYLASQRDIDVAKKQRLPSLGVEAETNTQLPNLITLRIEQPIWTAGEITSNIRASEVAANLQAAKTEQVKLALIKDIQYYYFETLRMQNRLEVAHSNKKELDSLMRAVNRRANANIASISDFIQVKSRYQNASKDVFEIQRRIEDGYSELKRLTGSEIKELEDFIPTEITDEMLKELVEIEQSTLPSIQVLSLSIDKAEQDLDRQKAKLYPRLVGGVESSSPIDRSDFSQPALFLKFTYNTGNGFSGFDEVDSLRIKLDVLRADLDQELSAVQLENKQLVAKLQMLSGQTDSIVSIKKSADDMLTSYRRQLEVGKKSWLDVLNAQRDKVESYYAHVDHRHELEHVKHQIKLQYEWSSLGK